MTEEELVEIIEKYRKLSAKVEIDDEDKSHQYERFADWVSDSIETFESTEDEKDLWELFLEYHSEGWDVMLPDGGEDD